MLFCHITSKVKSDPYQELLQEKGGNGFPYLVFLDADGDLLAKHEGLRSVAGLLESSGALKAIRANEAKADAGDPKAMLAVFSAQLTLRMVTHKEGQKRLASFVEKKQVTEQEVAAIRKKLVNIRVHETVQSVMAARSRQAMEEASAKFGEMRKAGQIPTDFMAGYYFWNWQLAAAGGAGKSKELIEIAQGWKKTLDPEQEDQKAMIEQLTKLIEQAKKESKKKSG